jgi:diacylglycerol kinase family enzyme
MLGFRQSARAQLDLVRTTLPNSEAEIGELERVFGPVPRPVVVPNAADHEFFRPPPLLERLDPRLKRSFGRLGILAQGMAELPRYAWPRLELAADGEPIEASFAAVCNIPFYGGAFALAPDACCDNGRLDLVTYRGRGVVSAIGFALALARGGHLGRGDVAVRRVERVVLSGPAGAAVQIDGDTSGAELPVEIAVDPRPLALLAPPGPLSSAVLPPR